MASHYGTKQAINVGDKTLAIEKKWDASLTPDAWLRYNKFEDTMLNTGLQSNRADLMTPTLDRLSKSTLKAAVLIAASRRLEAKVVVSEEDLIKAIAYCEQWRDYAVEIINGVGTTTHEKNLQNIFKMIQRHPGCLRSEVMQAFHLRARDADMILETLEQRGLISRQKTGRTERLNALAV